MPKKARPGRPRADRQIPDGWLTVTQAAMVLRCRYQKARDLILTGRLGERKFAEDHVTIIVSKEGVRKYLESEKEKKK